MKKTALDFVYDQWTTVPPVEKVDLSGKTVMVVGGNAGIGFEATKHFASMNPHRLIIGCRNQTKGEEAVKDLKKSTGYKNCEIWIVDLANFTSVNSFADRVRKECNDLHILVMNAGILTKKYETTVDGWEPTAGTPSRLVVVASDVHYWATIESEVQDSSKPLEKLSSKEYCTPARMGQRYYDSKLLNVLFVRSLADRLQSVAPLTVESVNPGFCYSNLRGAGITTSLEAIFNFLLEKLFAWTSEQGARQLVWAAIGEQGNEEKMKGAYISKAQVVEPSDFVMSEEGRKFQEKLWQETVDILSQVSPKVKTVIGECLAK
ncbi:hypothetical protein HYDPIDRAFT_28663 [Hydnomerulius pinastri MD-312]|uniref:Uncharacterized protein n=1 Tax=Hydnomerulius pinastri MD-312 TaxID=994086 RepID=A0A0C9WEU6_9AGAM|nr:hypothetical protein HYDPIDRAFT_28663 [Hydnomerulius pinastri MD-312]